MGSTANLGSLKVRTTALNTALMLYTKFTSGHMSATLFAVVVTKFPSLPLNKWQSLI